VRVDFVANALQEIVTVHGLSVPATTQDLTARYVKK